MGLDLSTRAAAAVVAPLHWGGDWLLTRSLVVTGKLEDASDEGERADRNERVASEILELASAYRVGTAWIEGYAFGQVHRAHHLGEVGGVVRNRLRQAGIQIRVANMGSARKLLLGAVPKGKGAAKHAAFEALVAAGMPFRSARATWLDEADAFVALNLGLSESGGYCFAMNSNRG